MGGRFYVNAALAQAFVFQSYFKHLRCFGRGFIIHMIGPGGNMKRQNRLLCHFQESSERILNILDLECTCFSWFFGLYCNSTVQFISLQCFWPTVYNSSTTNMIYETHFARWWYHWDALSSATLYRLAPSQPKRLQGLINRSYPKAIKVSPRWYLYCNQQFCASSKVIITSNMAKCDEPWVTSHRRTHGSRIETKRSSLRSQINGDQWV